MKVLRKWCEDGYAHLRAVDHELAERWAVRPSIKLTSVKPSGTVSLLAGATPGHAHAHTEHMHMQHMHTQHMHT